MSEIDKLHKIESSLLIEFEDALAYSIRLEKYEEESKDNFYKIQHFKALANTMKNLLKEHFPNANYSLVGYNVIEQIIHHIVEDIDEDFVMKPKDEQDILRKVQFILDDKR